MPLALRELASPGADIAARWEAMPVTARRDVVRLLMRVTILPQPPRAPFDPGPDSIRIEWVTGG